MTTNRSTRDQIITRALDMTDSPTLDQKERPNGIDIDAGARSIGWLQDALDLFHTKFPMSGTLTKTSLTFTKGVDTYALPSGYIQEYKNGLVYVSSDSGLESGRVYRTSLDKILEYIARTNAATSNGAKPGAFAILSTTQIKVFPTPDKGYTLDFWYYALPAVLAGGDIPAFPSDWILSEYLHLRHREWLQILEPGSAVTYATQTIKDLASSGISVEPEPDEVALDPFIFRGQSPAGYGVTWMGDTIPR